MGIISFIKFVFILDLLTRQTLKCDGPSKDMRSCNENDCPSWTPWSEWSQCSFTCGGGTCTRERKCRLPDGTTVPSGQCTDGKQKRLNNYLNSRGPEESIIQAYSC